MKKKQTMLTTWNQGSIWKISAHNWWIKSKEGVGREREMRWWWWDSEKKKRKKRENKEAENQKSSNSNSRRESDKYRNKSSQ